MKHLRCARNTGHVINLGPNVMSAVNSSECNRATARWCKTVPVEKGEEEYAPCDHKKSSRILNALQEKKEGKRGWVCLGIEEVHGND